MNFVTLYFSLFFLVVLTIFSFCPRSIKVQSFLLLCFNLFFYACAGIQFLPLLFFVAFLNYVSAKLTNGHPPKKHTTRRTIIHFIVALQILLLGFYKYYEFFILNTEALLSQIGLQISLIGLLPSVDILLPVGLSFYIFQGLSYSIDRYRDISLKPRSYLEVLTFISFFPTVLAGPIMRSNQFFGQFIEEIFPQDREFKEQEKKWINQDIAEGFTYILSGLFKKVVLASYLSEHIVRDVFQNPDFYSSETVLIASYAYAMQIFCDFSGYSDLAIGIGRLMGFKIPINFNAPYLATSLQDFWHRWHISLSTWLRDYLYISLGGNRKGNKYLNLFITMTLGGLWHGAHLRFLIWGMAHGLGLIINHAWQKICPLSPKKEKKEYPLVLTRIYSFFTWFITFHCITILWLFFRADTTEKALEMLQRISLFTTEGDGYSYLVLVAIFTTMIIQIIGKHCFQGFSYVLEKAWLPLKILIIALCSAIILKMGPDGVLPFIYFQF